MDVFTLFSLVGDTSPYQAVTCCGQVFQNHSLITGKIACSIRRFYSCINQTLTSRHRVKEELLRGQATNEGRLNEATCLRTVIVFLVVGKGAIRESIGDALALNGSLTETRHHLCDVQGLTLGTRSDHGEQTVFSRQRLLTRGSRIRGGLIQNAKDLIFKLLLVGLSRVVVEQIQMNLKDHLLHLLLLLLDLGVNQLLRVFVCNQVADAHAESIQHKEVLHGVLERIQKGDGVFRTAIIVGDVDDAFGRLHIYVTVHHTLCDVTLNDLDVVVRRRGLLLAVIGFVTHLHVDRWQERTEHLLTRPARLIHQWATRRRHDSVKALVPHHEVHELAAREFDAWLGQAVGSDERILINSDHGLRMTRCDNMMRHGRNLFQLYRRFGTLGYVKIHLRISLKFPRGADYTL